MFNDSIDYIKEVLSNQGEVTITYRPIIGHRDKWRIVAVVTDSSAVCGTSEYVFLFDNNKNTLQLQTYINPFGDLTPICAVTSLFDAAPDGTIPVPIY